MKTKTILAFILTVVLVSCAPATKLAPQETAIPTLAFSPVPPTPTIIPTPTIEPGKGRIVLDFETTPQKIIVRSILDNFLIGVGTTDPKGCVSKDILQDFRLNGINYFLPFTSWASVENSPGDYTNDICPGDEFIKLATQSGATLNGHCTIFLMNEPWLIPNYAFGHTYEEQKLMLESFVKATVRRFSEIKIWDLNEPIAQNAFGWSREQNYDLFVSASQWVHEVNPDAKVMINMIPIPNSWSGLYYDPNKVLDDLISRGLEADVIGIELYYGWAKPSQQDTDGYPTLEWVKQIIDMFRGYHLPIIFSEVGVPGVVQGIEKYEQQADWLEAFIRLAHDDPDVIGATWYFVRDDAFLPYAGLTNSDYTLRPVGKRLMMLAEEWNPSVINYLNDKNYIDLATGEYEVIIDRTIFRINVIDGQVITIPFGQIYRPTITSSPTITLSPTIINSGYTDLYDNFNNSLYDGSFNNELWWVGGQESDILLQTEGVFTILKQGGPQNCLSVMANNYNNFVPDTPFYYQADVKVDPQFSKGPVQMWVVAKLPDRSFESYCGFEHSGRNVLFVSCWNDWLSNDTMSEEYDSKGLQVKLNEWHTFRIDYDPSVTTFTYFIDNKNIGFYQVLASDLLRNASFKLNFGVCAPQDSSTKGYFDNIRIGFVK